MITASGDVPHSRARRAVAGRQPHHAATRRPGKQGVRSSTYAQTHLVGGAGLGFWSERCRSAPNPGADENRKGQNKSVAHRRIVSECRPTNCVSAAARQCRPLQPLARWFHLDPLPNASVESTLELSPRSDDPSSCQLSQCLRCVHPGCLFQDVSSVRPLPHQDQISE